MADNSPNSKRKPKYLSVRKALQELKLNEEELKQMIDRGQLQAVYEENELKLSEDDVSQLKNSTITATAGALPEPASDAAIDDEDLYHSSDRNFESLFLSRSGISAAEKADLEALAQSRARKKNAAIESASSSKADAPGTMPAVTSPVEDQHVGSDTKKTVRRAAPPSVLSAQISAPDVPALPDKALPGMAAKAHKIVAKVRQWEQHQQIAERMTRFLEQRRYLIWLALILLAFLSISNVGLWLSLSNIRQAMSHKVAVKTALVRTADFEPEIVLSGQVVPGKIVPVFAQENGTVAEILVETGKRVEAGQSVVRLHNTTLQRELQIAWGKWQAAQLRGTEAKAQLYTARKKLTAKELETVSDWEKQLAAWQSQISEKEKVVQENSLPALATEESRARQQALVQECAELGTNLDKLLLSGLDKLSSSQWQAYLAEMHYKAVLQESLAAKQVWARWKEAEARLTIAAPVSGEIWKLQVQPGQQLEAGMEIARIVDLVAKHVECQPARMVLTPGFYQGAMLEIWLAGSDRAISGDLLWPDSGTLWPETQLLTIAMVGKMSAVAWGTPATVKFRFPKHKAMLVPKQCILSSNSNTGAGPIVWCAVPNGKHSYILRSVAVKLGMSDAHVVEILEGLTGSETIVVESNWNLSNLSDGMRATEM